MGCKMPDCDAAVHHCCLLSLKEQEQKAGGEQRTGSLCDAIQVCSPWICQNHSLLSLWGSVPLQLLRNCCTLKVTVPLRGCSHLFPLG